jgi:quinoprotein glucose dehydrogenase
MPLLASLLRRTSSGALCLGCAYGIFLLTSTLLAAEEAFTPALAPASEEAQQQITAFKVASGFQAEVAAAEPEVANPIAFCFDERGRIFVCETYRANKATPDNRGHIQWLEQDLAAQTIEDRAGYIRRNFPNDLNRFTDGHDRVRMLEDRDADGRYETASVFADGFNEIVDGLGSGILVRGGDVFYACIPNLWKLRDTKGVGRADERTSLHYGYGVRWALYGHDLHGLCLGPDGKLYYSVGDRGFNVSAAGKNYVMPDRGAVFRCNLDGSDFEVVATGLRNPQELAFDKYGNLFTGDNNSDAGDKARWVFVVEGADTGWRMHYQYPNDRGPWNREKLWHPQFAGQAAYVMPPIAHIASGPSGLTYNPGVGLPEEFANDFLLCDFHGASKRSGVNAISLKPKGASWEVTKIKPFVTNLLATDVQIGPDSAVYVSDWVHGWEGLGKGRIYRFRRPEMENDPLRKETQALLIEDLTKRSSEDLARLLEHPDMRVRLNAQWTLAERGPRAVETFSRSIKDSKNQLARIHAIWGLGQIGRGTPDALKAVVETVADADAEVRGQSAKVLGDCKFASAQENLVKMLLDEEPRVRYLAAQSLGKLKESGSVIPLVELLRRNKDEDVVIRHAASLALSRCADAPAIAALSEDNSPSVRLAAVLALRQIKSPELTAFLADSDPRVQVEAVRAIHDVPVPVANVDVAALIDRPFTGSELDSDAFWRRTLNTHYRMGTLESAKAVARFATRQDVSAAMRHEALEMLGVWAKPANLDRVSGEWRPLDAREASIAVEAVREMLPRLLATDLTTRSDSIKLGAQIGISEVAPMLVEVVKDRQRYARESVDALFALERLGNDQLRTTTDSVMADERPDVRAAAVSVLARIDPDAAIPALEATIQGGTLIEKKSAMAVLGAMPAGKADTLLATAMQDLLAGEVPAEAQLELLSSAAERKDPAIVDLLARFESGRKSGDPLAPYRETLFGGDAEIGRQIFFEKAEVNCVRCHRVGQNGGEVGPELTKIGSEKQRDYLLQAIVDPNAAIAKGFESVMLVLDDGLVLAGVLRDESKTQVRLITAEGDLKTISKESIEQRASGKSAMPEDLPKKISKRELRDLVEFLSTCTKSKPGH